MKIISLKILSGSNQWSVSNQRLIEMLIDLDVLDKYPTNKICGFYTRLKWLMPSLYRHSCSNGYPGGFLQSVKTGISLASVVEHIARELQCLAGMNADFGITKPTGKQGEYYIVFSYQQPAAGKYAAEAAVNVTSAILKEDFYNIEKDLLQLKLLRGDKYSEAVTASFPTEAVKPQYSMLQAG
ncbi:MAG: hypothetical protein V4717_23765 [Bacteroidota bacterium]